MEITSEIQQAESQATIQVIAANTEVIEAQANAAVAEANERTAIAEARAEHADEIVSEEIEPDEPETEINDIWLDERFSRVLSAVEAMNQLQQAETVNWTTILEAMVKQQALLTEAITIMKMMNPSLQLTPQTSEKEPTITENPANVAVENPVQKTNLEKKYHKI